MPDMRVQLGPLTLANPVLAAAGTFGYGLEFADACPLHALGALVTKTLTRQPRAGHPPPRLIDTAAGMMNAVGLQNVGLEAFLRDKLPGLRALRVPVIVSILGDAPEPVAAMTQALDQADGVAGLELNLSCPNVQHPPAAAADSRLEHAAARMVAQSADATEMMVTAARAQTRKLLIAKLSPDVTTLVPIAQAAERAGADALTISNTFTGMSVDAATRRSRLGQLTGGLSGPAVRPLAVYRVWYTAPTVRLPIIGLGGIVRAEDAVEFFLAGATAVAVGTANFANPQAPVRVLRGLQRYLARQGMTSVQQLRGALVS